MLNHCAADIDINTEESAWHFLNIHGGHRITECPIKLQAKIFLVRIRRRPPIYPIGVSLTGV